MKKITILKGQALMLYYTNKIKLSDVLGKSAIICKTIDDMKTQPSGNAGIRIACGVIKKGDGCLLKQNKFCKKCQKSG